MNDIDLIISSVVAPLDAFINQTIPVSWRVTNLGTDSALNNWYDEVYVSDDQFLDSSDTYLTIRFTQGNNTPLASGGSYTATQNIYINPNIATGNRYLLFVTDRSNDQDESNDDNNVFAQAITINRLDVDLEVTRVEAPTTVDIGLPITLSWTVTNQGTVSTLPNEWSDIVYISDDQFLDEGDRYITVGGIRANDGLGSLGSYTIIKNVLIPTTYLGDHYLLFVTDRDNNQGETNETNNIFAQAITINPPNVDLVITGQAPTTANLNEIISLSWTVKNQGTGYVFGYLSDGVYISDDPFLDGSDVFITSFNAGENIPLAPGSSYTVTQDLLLPRFVGSLFPIEITPGDRYLLIVTGSSQPETNETNNVFAQAITITEDIGDVDLVVTDAQAPTTAAVGETISVSWTVKNLGTNRALANWYDYIYISDDQFFDSSDTLLLGSFVEGNASLSAGGSYTATLDIDLIPYIATGDVYLLFVADRDNNQSETNETNNVFAKAINIEWTPSDGVDLAVTDANAPTIATLGETISVSWTVTSLGADSAFSNWFDYIYISDDQFFDSNDTYLSSRSGETLLAPGDNYTATLDIDLPTNLARGDVYDGLRQRYLLFVADGNNKQVETNQTNNVFAKAITLKAPGDGVDLVVTAANAPTSATLNERISVSWTVTNQGTDNAFSYWSWSDYVYISNDQFFDSNDSYLTSRSGQRLLASGASYTATLDIDIPNNLATGDVYLLFVTDTENYQVETNETNNVFAKAITIKGPGDVDLVITDVQAPITGILYDEISVSWTVKNQGTDTAFADWYDEVYISDDQFFDSSDRYLESFEARKITPLAAGGSYTTNLGVELPSDLGTGDRYLLFVTDPGNEQGETNETNNVFAKAITINAPEDDGGDNVDLVLTNAQAPTIAGLGETISVSWTVTNQGTNTAFSNWYDKVYISRGNSSSVESDSLLLSERSVRTSIAGGSSYTITLDITLPIEPTRPYPYGEGSTISILEQQYLLFVADESRDQNETDELNNSFILPITVKKAVDLVVSAAQAPNTATLGETISVSWTVTKEGTSPALGSWNDSVYISEDQYLDEGDIFVSTRSGGNLAAGASYTATQDITVPVWGDTGDVYLLFVADDYVYKYYTEIDNQGETIRDNNVRAVAISLYAEDQIFKGTSARDTLTGDDRSNLITGLQGADTLTGGAGSDKFVYTSIRDAGDTITDFTAGTDKIDLSQLFQSLSLGSLDYESATTQGYLSFGTHSSNSTVLVDIDGTAGRGRPTPLLTVAGVSASTLAQSDNFVF
ncbi:type I secretion C-terminal target domain-containing protein [Desmonostoc muscorum LEGE 12446]|uniref:Type I secretion C-terminal target domain-containing protein n=1 Tax=Desmonostoc muscorum LEGE 12446 TaxID=1828758 RepID=A0A8J6ZNR2_DESMC|nr:CARDB domain-containing protein [Desmonostoc muscorum]MCF2150645.1 type I secretion C-terminal target domain-containing protein [Desmonostoc muscorum LEGE 12446]